MAIEEEDSDLIITGVVVLKLDWPEQEGGGEVEVKWECVDVSLHLEPKH